MLWKGIRPVNKEVTLALKHRKSNMGFGCINCRSTTTVSRTKTIMCLFQCCLAGVILKIMRKNLLRLIS